MALTGIGSLTDQTARAGKSGAETEDGTTVAGEFREVGSER